MTSAFSPPARVGARILLPLALLAALAPFGTDLYLPAFPQMVSDLGTNEAGVQLSLTAFLLGAGVGQLVFGPLSDRFGRMKPLLVGLVIAVLAGVATALAPTAGFLVAARLVQGLTASAGMVIGRAIIADLTTGREAARALSMMMVVGGVAPVLAPVVGAVLAAPIGWRGLLWVVTLLSAVALTLTLAFIRESHPGANSRDGNAGRGRLRALLDRAYLGNAFAVAFAFVTLMAYISASPFIYQQLMGLSQIQYGLAFGANALGLVALTWMSARLTARFRIPRMAAFGLAGNAVSILVFAALAFSPVSPLWLMLPLLTAVASLGLVFGNITALALSAVRRVAGTGSAVLGLLQFGLAGAVAPLVSLGGGTSAIPLALAMLVATVAANLAFLVAGGHRQGDLGH